MPVVNLWQATECNDSGGASALIVQYRNGRSQIYAPGGDRELGRGKFCAVPTLLGHLNVNLSGLLC